MNPQTAGAYTQYPPPPPQVQYQYPPNPYPPPQQQLPYQYSTQAQPQQQSQSQYFRTLPQGTPQQQQPQQLQSQQQQQQRAAQAIPQSQTPVRNQPQRHRQQTAQPTSSRQNARRPSPPSSPDNGPGAPLPEPNSPELEEQLMSALRRDQQTDNEHDDDEDDEEDGEGNESEAIFNLPPPPEGNYPSEAELEKNVHAWSLEHGYEMVRRASKKNASGLLYKRYFHCSKHGKLANTGKLTDKTRVRVRRKSNRTGCPMSLAAVAVDPSNPTGEWQIRHRKTHHNHGPLDALALAGHRRRARMGGVEKAVDGLFAIGTPTAQVLQFLQRTNPGGLFTRTDVANMKLKYKKYGTCVKEPGQYAKEGGSGTNSISGGTGFPSACLFCRAKKTKCDSVRPVCGTCAQQAGARCEYDHDPGSAHPNQQNQAPPTAPPQQTPNSTSETPQQSRREQQPTLSTQRGAAEQILADLQKFQAEHVRPKKLDLSSSSVEILAQSSCGNGDSYKAVPTLYIASDWQNYSDAFMEASMKENTADVLNGTKAEPVHPPRPADGEEVDVEEWNEYIKQLAIYHRRNSMLLGSLWGTLAPSFRARIQGHKRASEAWNALEEACSPRGSDQAFRLFNEVLSISLQTSGGRLEDYVRRLDAAYTNLTRLKLSPQYPHDRIGRQRTDLTPALQQKHGYAPPAPAGNAAEVFSEESLCFLFLRNLGEGHWRKWVETLCSTSNVGGFGTGFRLGFRELTKKAMEWEQTQGRGGAGVVD